MQHSVLGVQEAIASVMVIFYYFIYNWGCMLHIALEKSINIDLHCDYSNKDTVPGLLQIHTQFRYFMIFHSF